MAAAEESKVRQDSAALVVEETKMTPIRISQNASTNARGSVTE